MKHERGNDTASGPETVPAPEQAQHTNIWKVAAASFIGTAVEWYDFFLYGTAAALIFNRLFIPSFDPMAGTLAAFAASAVGFVARPLGGVIFSHFGDKPASSPSSCSATARSRPASRAPPCSTACCWRAGST